MGYGVLTKMLTMRAMKMMTTMNMMNTKKNDGATTTLNIMTKMRRR